ncbi:MAG: tetratricopeptide repeat protein, partial [Candidatus Zixiibacteriota bacterium]
MKAVTRLLIPALMIVIGSGMTWAQKARKLPVSAYIKSAKIEILSGEFERYQTAIAMLDSLFMHYGPHAEGLKLMGQIMVDLLEKTPNPSEKAPFLEKMVAYFDSLHMCCNNKDIKKSYRKGCKKYITIADSTVMKYWRQFFNAGVNQFNTAENLRNDLQNQTDTAIISRMERDFQASVDSAILNMKLATIAIPDSARTYLIIDKAYGLKGEYQIGIDWLRKALDKSGDSATIIPSIAYDYIQMNDYCGAIPYYKADAEMHPDDIATLTNLAICYHNCEMYDSAASIYRKVIALDPNNADMYFNLGFYYNIEAGMASDSAAKYQEEKNEKMASTWRQKRDEAFDSARVYFKNAFELNPDDVSAAEQFGVVSVLRGNCEEAIKGFRRVVELQPQQTDSWISLGDCYLTLKQFDDAIAAYEKVVKLNPRDIRVWEHLKDLYFETGQKTKLAEAEKKLAELKQ